MKPSKYSLEFIDETMKMVHDAVDGKSDRPLDLRIERIFNRSEVHDDHLDRFPDSVRPYTSSLDACRHLMREVCPQGYWTTTAEESKGQYGASVVDGSFRAGSSWAPSLELAILAVVLQRAYVLKKDGK